MSTYNHTDIINNDSRKNDKAIWNDPDGQLDAAIGDLTGLPTTPKTSVAGALGAVALGTTATTISGAIAEVVNGAIGGLVASDALLIAWTEAGAYEIVENPIIYDATYPELLSNDSSNTVTWPDGKTGEFAVTAYDTTWVAISAYTITHAGTATKTVTQAAITRDATTGNVTAKPALTIA